MFTIPPNPYNYTYIYKSADQDVTNAGVSDDTELQFATVANGIYAIDLSIIASANDATGDYIFRFAGAANTMSGRGVSLSLTTADAIQSAVISAAAAIATNSISVGMVADLTVPTAIRAWFAFKQLTGATTLKFQFGNAAASAGRTSRTLAGSYLAYARLA